MKRIMLIFLLAASVVIPFALAEEGMPPANMQMGKTTAMYQCPMDGYVSDKPGKCPLCGMQFEEPKESK